MFDQISEYQGLAKSTHKITYHVISWLYPSQVDFNSQLGSSQVMLRWPPVFKFYQVVLPQREKHTSILRVPD